MNKLFLVSWNVTKRCNLRCAHCYLGASELDNGKNELSTSEGKALINQIAEINPNAMLVFSGGEPLMRQDLLELIRYAADRDLMAVLGTNGTLVDEEMARKLLESGISGVGISLDSLDPEKHDTFRGVTGAWKGAVRGIDACKKIGLEFQVQTTVTKENFKEISELIKYASDMGAKAFNLFFLVCTGRGHEMTDISPAQYEKMLIYLAEVQSKYGMMVRARCAPHFRRIISSRDTGAMSMRGFIAGCMAGTCYCRITPNGDVTPCPYLPIELGNVRRLELAEIFESSMVLRSLRNPRLKGKCSICEFASLCGGCRARAFAILGDYLEEDPLCLYKPTGKKRSIKKREEELVWSDAAKERMEDLISAYLDYSIEYEEKK